MLCCHLWTMLCCTQWTMLSTRLFSHDNNVVTALFNHQYCYNLLTRLSDNRNDSEQACSINIVFSCFNNREQPLLLYQCWQQCWNDNEQRTLFVQQNCSVKISVLVVRDQLSPVTDQCDQWYKFTTKLVWKIVIGQMIDTGIGNL